MSVAADVDLMPHNPLGPICTAACVHLGAACPNFAWMEDWCAGKGQPSWHESEAAIKMFPVRRETAPPPPPPASHHRGASLGLLAWLPL
eukprot:COSAG04_NODE_393_length_15147_cov_44.965643_10_plen_89_part_00